MSDLRRFSVHPTANGAGHIVEGASFVDAALAFVDRWHPPANDQGDVALIVTDEVSGRQQCFRIDLARGEAAACD